MCCLSEHVYLRQELKAMGINTRGRQLRRVVLRAKSRKGRAEAVLQWETTTKMLKPLDVQTMALVLKPTDSKPQPHCLATPGQQPRCLQIHMDGRRVKVHSAVVFMAWPKN